MPARLFLSRRGGTAAVAAGAVGQAVLQMRGPRGAHVGIAAAPLEQLAVAADLCELAVVDDRDPVGPHGGGQPVRDDDRRTPLEQDVQGGLDFGLRLQVEAGGGFVEDEYPWLGE